MNSKRYWILGISFIVGMAVFALLAGRTLKVVKRMDEYVTVKGLSEREVPADLAIWPVAFTVTETDLTKLQEQIERGRNVVHQFLTENGFESGEITNAPPQISEVRTDKNGPPAPPRYQANITVLLRSTKVAKVRSAMETCDKLVRQGIVLGGDNYMSRTQFLFTGLNQIKPDMIQEATKNARTAAGRFAADSNSKIGAIRRAVQGPFEVYDVDSSSPDKKIVRVVTTVDFYLN